ncbi:MAG: hypothetical protein HWN65_04100 [Candidatus Helarchaeota archaeon]|nr:hypothetical protein [Candidatus Helarchaeota archaeon]
MSAEKEPKKTRHRSKKKDKIKEEEKVKGSFFVGIIMIIIGGLLILGVLLSAFEIPVLGEEVRAYFLQDSIMNFIYGIIFIVTAWGIIQAEEWALGVLSVTLFLIFCNRLVAIISGTENVPLWISIPVMIGAIFLIIYLYKTRKIYD